MTSIYIFHDKKYDMALVIVQYLSESQCIPVHSIHVSAMCTEYTKDFSIKIHNVSLLQTLITGMLTVSLRAMVRLREYVWQI